MNSIQRPVQRLEVADKRAAVFAVPSIALDVEGGTAPILDDVKRFDSQALVAHQFFDVGCCCGPLT